MLSFDSASASVPDSTDWLSTPLASLAPLESALRCQVCKDFFNTPMMTSCSHTFCSLCIRRYLSQEGRCPACRTADQELKLRRNWVVEELVNRFVEGRGGLLEFARNSAELERKRLDEDDSPRPKKRRKVQAPRTQQPEGAPGAERRSTRSRSRRDAAQASQDSTKELIVADSDDAGSEYEDEDCARSVRPATKPHQAQEEPVDGLVACPGCGKRMKEEVVFTHLDHCTSSGGSEVPEKQAPANGVLGPSQHPRASIAYIPPDSLPAGKARERLPTLAYSMLNDAALRKKLQALGIPSQGPKLLLQKRHTEWVNLWNANCDSRDPKPKRKLLEELDVWERTQGRQILQGMHTAAGGGQGTGVMAKDFDGESWMRGNKNDFDELVRRAREKKATAPHADDGQKEPESGSTSKNTAQQIFPNANAPSDTDAVASDMVSDPESRAGARALTAKSPFFDRPTERETKTELPGAKLMSSPSELSVDVEQSQSHGSHVNGVIALSQ